MNKKILESYQANKRLIERNTKKIEDEQCKDVPAVMGKVTGSAHDFPYTKQRFTVQMNDPAEVKRVNKNITKWQQEITQAQKEIDAVEQFIESISDVRIKEIFTYRYIDNMKIRDIAKKIGYSKGRISQIISNFVKD